MESSPDNSRKDRKKHFGKSDLAEVFLRQQIQSLQVELLNVQTRINSGFILCMVCNLMCRKRESMSLMFIGPCIIVITEE